MTPINPANDPGVVTPPPADTVIPKRYTGRIAAILALIAAITAGAAPAVADMDISSSAGIAAGLLAITGIVIKFLDGWQKYEDRTTWIAAGAATTTTQTVTPTPRQPALPAVTSTPAVAVASLPAPPATSAGTVGVIRELETSETGSATLPATTGSAAVKPVEGNGDDIDETALYGEINPVTGMSEADVELAVAAPPIELDEGEDHGRLTEALREHGLKYPTTTIEEARLVGLPLSYALAFLEQESTGRDGDGAMKFGLNVFGHDAVDNIRGGLVTAERYAQYLRKRRAGKGMQGVGPTRLTWYGLQDMADRMGGCAKARYSMRVGFAQAKALIARHGVEDGVARFHGTDASAQQYARDWAQKQAMWHQWLTEH